MSAASRSRVQSGSADSLKEGWLMKKGSFVRSWKRRYFILTSSALSYYTDETLSELKGSVPILSTSRVMHRDGSSHQFKFGLCTGKRLLEIACSSDEDRTRWKKCIEELVNRLQVEGMKNGTLNTAPAERLTVFDDIIGKNRLDRTNMVDDTPMNRARKKQQQEQIAQQKQQQKPQQSGGDAILKKDKQEKALWGGSDSDVSEEGESEEEREECGTRSSSTKAARGAPGCTKGARRRLAGNGATKTKKGKGGTDHGRSSSHSGKDGSVAPDLPGHQQHAQHEQHHADTTTKKDKSSHKKVESHANDNSPGGNPDIRGLRLGGDSSNKDLDGWEEIISDKGEIYYYHRAAKITRWEKPTAEVTDCINRRLADERRQMESATEKRMLEQRQNKFVEEELQDYTNQIQATVIEQIKLWKHPVGKKRPRVLGELLNAIPALLGPTVIPSDSSLAQTPLIKSDPPAKVKKTYRQAVRLVHPDKIAGTGSVIDMEKKMLAAEVFITINEAFEKFRSQHEEI